MHMKMNSKLRYSPSSINVVNLPQEQSVVGRRNRYNTTIPNPSASPRKRKLVKKSSKRDSTSLNSDLDETLYNWYKIEKTLQRGEITPARIQQKAEEIAREFNGNNFIVTPLWVERFMARHKFKKTHKKRPEKETEVTMVSKCLESSDTNTDVDDVDDCNDSDDAIHRSMKRKLNLPNHKSAVEAFRALTVLRKFVESREVGSDVYENILCIEIALGHIVLDEIQKNSTEECNKLFDIAK